MRRFVDRAYKLPPKTDSKSLLRSLLGGTLAIFILEILTFHSGHVFMMAPFGATCVLLFAASKSPLAQPRNVIFGHFISALVGLVVLKAFGVSIIGTAIAVGVAICLMQITRCVHPPAGANPLVILLTADQINYNWDFLLFPVISGAVALTIVAWFVNNFSSLAAWPEYWFGFLDSKNKE